jgi:DNA-directed RNA polymerase subunit RPC12/RpoP
MEQPKQSSFRHYPCEKCGRQLSFTYDQLVRNISITCTCGSKIKLTPDALTRRDIEKRKEKQAE